MQWIEGDLSDILTFALNSMKSLLKFPKYSILLPHACAKGVLCLKLLSFPRLPIRRGLNGPASSNFLQAFLEPLL